ncbi:hypothetical protein B484DRAFT_407712 [Ochromonadaceae sp. CCMP2298]|nr:hypothetical protein B484DRAFT_407712 [Ochromonadaceae sp. CCMP2298]
MEDVDPELLPENPNEAALRLLDSEIRQIPALCDDGQAVWLGLDDFPISPLRSSVLTAAAPISVALLLAPTGPLERLASCLRLQHALADKFRGSLRKCAGKQGSISFEMRASPADIACLFGWSGGPTATLKVCSSAGTHRISYLVTDDVLLKPCIKEERPCTSYSYFPIVDVNYRGGGFIGQNYIAVLPCPDCIVLAFDLLTHTLMGYIVCYW